MNDSLSDLLKKAKNNSELKARIYATRNDRNPVDALCKLATAEGFPITSAELIYESEKACAEMLRSVNGGGVEAPEGWDDLYEMFFAALAFI